MNIKKLYPTTRGGKYHGRTIKYMLENLLYKRMTHYKDNKIKNKELTLM